MRILVTGGFGFIGSNIVLRLNSENYNDIYIVDDITMSNSSNTRNMRYSGFVSKDSFYSEVLQRIEPDVIFHQGAITDTTFIDRDEMMRVNYRLSVDIFEYCKSTSTRLIYASSAAVYGHGKMGYTEIDICEEPLNVYAESKLAFDNYVRTSRNENQVVGLRYFNVFGCGEDHKLGMASPINQFYRQSLTGKINLFNGSERFYRDFVSINDIVDVNMFFFKNESKIGIFNCGSGEVNSFKDVADIVSSKTGVPINTIPFPEYLLGKYQSYTKANLKKLRNEGYVQSFRDFRSEVSTYIDEMKANNELKNSVH